MCQINVKSFVMFLHLLMHFVSWSGHIKAPSRSIIQSTPLKAQLTNSKAQRYNRPKSRLCYSKDRKSPVERSKLRNAFHLKNSRQNGPKGPRHHNRRRRRRRPPPTAAEIMRERLREANKRLPLRLDSRKTHPNSHENCNSTPPSRATAQARHRPRPKKMPRKL